MSQQKAWESEYRKSKLITKDNKPQSDILRAFDFLKSQGLHLENLSVLDIGSGAGRNSNYLAKLGNTVFGLEISETAIDIARKYAESENLSVAYIYQDIGKPFPFEEEKFDLILDITSSNSLNEAERESYLNESYRVLKHNGYFIVRALCKDGDLNAKYLLKANPEKEKDTYIIKEMNLIERVFSKKDFVDTYSKYFKILELIKKTSYSRMNNRVYKRNYWIAYLQKS